MGNIKEKILDLFMPTLTENFQIILGGDKHEIDINTLVITLSHLNTIVSEANRVKSGDKMKVELKVLAHNKGSFEIDLAVQSTEFINSVKSLFTGENVAYLSGLITVVGGVFKASKFLLGKKPKEVIKEKDQTTVVNYYGETKVFNADVINTYLDSPKTVQAVAQTMKALELDDSVESFNFQSKNEDVTIDREIFDELSKDEKLVQFEINIKNMYKVALTIVSPDFDFKRNWQCYIGGEKKSFIVDAETLKNEVLENGLKFGVGDSIIVDVEIKQVWDKQYNAYVNKSFAIVNYHSYIPKPRQSKLDM